MSAFTGYEREVIALLVGDRMPAADLENVIATGTVVSEDHTGAGYFLTVRHPSLPGERIVCDRPIVTGRLGELSCGFLIFLEAGTLTLECHGWGAGDLPRDLRERSVEISAS